MVISKVFTNTIIQRMVGGHNLKTNGAFFGEHAVDMCEGGAATIITATSCSGNLTNRGAPYVHTHTHTLYCLSPYTHTWWGYNIEFNIWHTKGHVWVHVAYIAGLKYSATQSVITNLSCRIKIVHHTFVYVGLFFLTLMYSFVLYDVYVDSVIV